MPFIIGLVGLIIAAAVWYNRAKSARNAAGDLVNAANDVRLAARRFGFRAKSNVHPADDIEDGRLAAAGLAAALAGVDGPLTRGEIDALTLETRVILQAEAPEARDIAAFGQWLAGQCGTPDEAVRRLTKTILRTVGNGVGEDVELLATRVAEAGGPLNERQRDVLDRMRRAFQG